MDPTRFHNVSTSVLQELMRAESQSMENMLQAWDKEIEAAFKALREKQAQIAQQKLQAHVEHQRDYHTDMAGEVLAENFIHRAEGLEVLAKATGDPIAIPGGFLLGNQSATLGELSGLIAEVSAEGFEGPNDPKVNQASLIHALSQGGVPHPSIMGELLQTLGIAPHLADEFKALGGQIDQAEKSADQKLPVQLKVQNAQGKFAGLGSAVGLIERIGTQQLFQLATQPDSLRSSGLSLGMPNKAFNQMLSSLFAGPKSSAKK